MMETRQNTFLPLNYNSTMQIKQLLPLILIATGTLATGSAIQFVTGGGRGHMFVLSPANDRVAFGSLVRVGYVTTPGDVSTFMEFATTTISHPGAAVAAQVGGFLTNPAASSTVAGAAKGKQIYLWVYNGTTTGGSTGAAIFTSTDSTWLIPNSFTGDATETSNLTLNLTSNVTAIAAPGYASAPSFSVGPVPVAGSSATGSIFTLGVPEPGTSLLASAAVLAMLARRRR